MCVRSHHWPAYTNLVWLYYQALSHMMPFSNSVGGGELTQSRCKLVRGAPLFRGNVPPDTLFRNAQ